MMTCLDQRILTVFLGDACASCARKDVSEGREGRSKDETLVKICTEQCTAMLKKNKNKSQIM